MGAFYFGCWHGLGHYLRDDAGRDYRYDRAAGCWTADMPFSRDGIDGKLTPKASRKQGAAALHHLDGWTAVAWHDYSVDDRGGSNSVIFLPGTLTFDEAVAEGRKAFPHIFARQTSPAMALDDKHPPT